MRIIQTLLAALVVTPLLAPSPVRAQAREPVECETPQECRARGLEAAAEGDYERFHDFAWRAIQKGPRNDPELMTLLARAQSLSGRPHDALVMLERLADMGVVTDAATSEDFRRVRALDGWAAFEARFAPAPAKPAAGPPAAPPAPSASVPPPPPLTAATPLSPSRAMRVPAPVAPPRAPKPVDAKPVDAKPVDAKGDVEEAASALRFTTLPFEAAGLAYDAVSARFIVGSREERKLSVIGERSGRLANLVGEDSAGFGAIEAIALDTREGNLWVASTPDDGPPKLHKLQLISGRLLFTAETTGAPAGARLTDIAVAPDGAVLALDAPNRRLLRLAPGSREPELLATLDLTGPVSLGLSPAGLIYVAFSEGIARLDGAGRVLGVIALPQDVEAARLTWIRPHRGALVAAARAGDGRFRILRISLTPNGRKAAGLDVIEADVPLAGPASLAIAGDELFYLARDTGYTGSGGMDLTIRRVRLPR